ncbi:MAG: HTTM domain-containing protein [Planctomycetes bacterium]|nr:HTTM domain-containing protein [Planctomycetota bacterium]
MASATEHLRDTPAAARDAWNRFWFRPTDPATLGVIRICAGLLLLRTHWVWIANHDAFFGPQAWLSAAGRAAFNEGSWSSWSWSHLLWCDSLPFDSTGLIWTLHVVALIAMAMLTLGLMTRAAAVASFLFTVSFANRAMGSTFGLDGVNAMLALYLMIGPAGAAFSLDNLIRKRRGKPPVGESVSANIAIRLIQLHMCYIYLSAALAKFAGETWWDGTAMWLAIANYEYQSIDVTFLAHWPLLLNFLTHVTLYWELSYCALVWLPRFRPGVILLAVPVHLGISLCMGMVEFGLVMLVGNAAFISPWIIRKVIPGGDGVQRKDAKTQRRKGR